MDSGATKREILEKKLEKRLQDPKTEPLISLPLDVLEDITYGFSTERVLGTGGCGVVYMVCPFFSHSNFNRWQQKDNELFTYIL